MNYISHRMDDRRDEDLALHHILRSMVDPFRSGLRRTLAQWILRALGLQLDEKDPEVDRRKREAHEVLGTYGLRIEWVDGRPWLGVADRHPGLEETFSGTHWAGRTASRSIYAFALRRLAGAERLAPRWYAGVISKGTRVPMVTVFPERDDLPGLG